MLLSYAHQFIFIHIDRTAGTSIQQALAPDRCRTRGASWQRRLGWLGGVNAVSGLYPSIQFREHVTAARVKQCLPTAVYAGMLKFAFVRNPWDRLVSRYAYLLRLQEHPRHRLVSRMPTFADYLRWEIRRAKMHQHSYVTDGNGKLIVDYLGRFETLHTDIAEIGRRLGMQLALPHVNSSAHDDYRSYYTAETRHWVAQAFQRDLDLFGYSFADTGATLPIMAARDAGHPRAPSAAAAG